MSNFIISFLILADKFFGKLKATPVKVLVYFFAFGGGFYLFVQWNTVPTLSTEVVVNSYRTTTNDKVIIALKQYRLYHSNDTASLAWLQVSLFTWLAIPV